ncbi:MAG TPA: AGE family epimerase/isomerase [Rhizomicrobium sp.]|jgi:mannose-1-phosphate guanylyltransferase/mannose-6-phosphate isomerase|nr:AGE family epimerase/isomerase [Rhizomicrobium sp.]
MKKCSIIPVILCGGEGSRLWPVSRRDSPKQFVRLLGEHSCFQQAALRLSRMEGAGAPVIVTGAAHEAMVRKQLEELSLDATIILEPEGRDSGPAVLAAAVYLANEAPDCVAIMQPADHYIPDIEKFQHAASQAAIAAAAGFIVTFGIAPTGPEISYGYIAPADPLAEADGVLAVSHFAEKPSRERAVEYLTRGYVWNSGIFAFAPQILLDEMRKFEPAIADCVESAIANARRNGNVVRLDAESFSRTKKKSLDHAVMEHTARAAVVPANFRWSDLGAWDAIHAESEKDARGNAVSGDGVVLIESDDCLVRAPHIPVAVIGLKNVGVIAEADGVVVCRLDASASVKGAVDALRAKGRAEAFRSGVTGGQFANLKHAARELSRWLQSSALPLWWAAGADHGRGGFFELLDGDARALAVRRRLRVQARQIYVYAGAVGSNGPWIAAVRFGLAYLRNKYRLANGFYRTQVADDGAPADDALFLYDQAFVLLALASAAKADVDREACVAEAANLRAALTSTCARDGGGFWELPAHGSRLQSNPHMHLLEAALAWNEVQPHSGWDTLAESIVRLCRESFLDRQTGALREFFDDAGNPMSGSAGHIVEPGHLFEWAWLLTRWSVLRGDAYALEAAHTLQQLGEAHGVDAQRGVAIDSISDDFSPLSRQARLWPQTERLKAALALASRAADEIQRKEMEQAALAAARGLSYYLHVSVPGLWRDKMRPDGTFTDEPSPASSLYHIACAINELRDYAS